MIIDKCKNWSLTCVRVFVSVFREIKSASRKIRELKKQTNKRKEIHVQLI